MRGGNDRARVILAGVVVPVLLAAGCGEDPAGEDAVVVFAAASTTDALTEIARRYLGDIKCSFNASSTISRQIEAGAAADIVLLANPSWMDYLAERDLIVADSRTDLLNNTLVLIGPASGTKQIEIVPNADVTKLFPAGARVAIGDPAHVPAGMYADQALRNLAWRAHLRDSLVTTVDVRAAVRLVEQGEADFAIVYGSDATGGDVRVVGTFPSDLHDPIRYPVALIAPVSDEAAKFLDFLHSDEASAVFARHGFTPLSQPAEVVSASILATTDVRAGSANEWAVIWLSVKVAMVCVLVSAIPGIFCGWLLARKRFLGKTIVDALVHLPLVVPPVAVGYVLLVLLGRNGAVGAWLKDSFGLDVAFTWKAAVIASAVMGFPLLVRAVRLSIEMSDRSLEQAAGTLGASPRRVFFTITLPLAMPGVLTGLILAFARSLGEFGATITFAGDMGGDTRTLPLAMYRFSQMPGGDAAVVRLILISVAIALIALVVSDVLARRMAKRLGTT